MGRPQGIRRYPARRMLGLPESSHVDLRVDRAWVGRAVPDEPRGSCRIPARATQLPHVEAEPPPGHRSPWTRWRRGCFGAPRWRGRRGEARPDRAARGGPLHPPRIHPRRAIPRLAHARRARWLPATPSGALVRSKADHPLATELQGRLAAPRPPGQPPTLRVHGRFSHRPRDRPLDPLGCSMARHAAGYLRPAPLVPAAWWPERRDRRRDSVGSRLLREWGPGWAPEPRMARTVVRLRRLVPVR